MRLNRMKYSEFPYQRLTVDSQNALMVDWLERFKDAHFRITVVDEKNSKAWSNPVWLD